MVPLLLVGLLSILGQIVLLRELVVAFYGVELVYILAIGVWLLAAAAGAASARRSVVPSRRILATLLFVCAVLLPLEVALARGSRLLLGGVPGAFLSFGQQVAVALAVLVPIGMVLGALFSRAAHVYVARNGTLASAYAIESAGGLVGGLLSTLALIWGLSNFTLALACSIVALLAAIDATASRHPARRVTVVGGAVVSAVLLAIGPSLDQAMTKWSHPGLLVAIDSPYGRLAVTRAGAQVSVFENDALSVETEGTDAEALAHLAALSHPLPRRVLLMGGTITGLLPDVLAHHPERVDLVEINGRLIETVAPYLPAATRLALTDPRVHTVLDDPRRFLTGAGVYDLVIAAMAEPESGQANRFYTREFFEQVARHLDAAGVLAFRLRGAENYWPPAMLRRLESIDLAAAAAFRDVLVLPGDHNVVIASNRPLVRDPAVLASRLDARGIRPRLVTPAYISYLYSNDRFAEVSAKLATVRAPINTDAQPICYQYASLIWLSKFFPTLGAFDPDFDRPWSTGWAAAIAGVLVLGLLVARRFAGARRSLITALGGMIGMVLESVVLLHYQLKNGVVYQDLGVLLTAVMAGLACGALLLNHVARQTSVAESNSPGNAGARHLSRAWGFGIAGAFVVLAVVIEAVVSRGSTIGLAAASALLSMTGVLVSAVFAYASLRGVPDQGRIVAPLYAADLAGGAMGSLIATLILIPFAGLALSAGAMAVLALALLVLV